MDQNLPCPSCGVIQIGQLGRGQCAHCLLKLVAEPPPSEASDLSSELEPDLTASVDRLGKLVPPRLFGDYELLEMIGRGGMGIVYKARQKFLNRVVALKMVLNWREATRDTLTRFTIEAEPAAMLDHPHIVPTYQIGDLDGQPFFSMKLVSGQNLAKKRSELVLLKPEEDVSAKTSRRSSREAQVTIAALLAKVARAVHFAHQHGVIHRDLKPTNILIDPEGEPHLTDFGVAKLLDQDHGLTQTDDVLGRPRARASPPPLISTVWEHFFINSARVSRRFREGLRWRPCTKSWKKSRCPRWCSTGMPTLNWPPFVLSAWKRIACTDTNPRWAWRRIWSAGFAGNPSWPSALVRSRAPFAGPAETPWAPL